MRQTFTTTMPDRVGAFLKASRSIAGAGANITRVSYNKAVDMHILFIEVEGAPDQLSRVERELGAMGYLPDGQRPATVILLEFELEDRPGEVLPVLETMGENIVLEGGPGAGQHTKMANQIAIAGALAGVCEALTYAKRAGLDPARVYETIRTGAARSGQLDIIAPKVLNGDFSAAFYLRHFVKDMGIASQECRDRGLELEVLEQVLADCRQIEAEGHGGEGTQALIRHYPWAD